MYIYIKYYSCPVLNVYHACKKYYIISFLYVFFLNISTVNIHQTKHAQLEGKVNIHNIYIYIYYIYIYIYIYIYMYR